MRLLSKLGGVFMAVRDLVNPRTGIYYVAISRKIDSNKPIKLRKKSILRTVRPNMNEITSTRKR